MYRLWNCGCSMGWIKKRDSKRFDSTPSIVYISLSSIEQNCGTLKASLACSSGYHSLWRSIHPSSISLAGHKCELWRCETTQRTFDICIPSRSTTDPKLPREWTYLFRWSPSTSQVVHGLLNFSQGTTKTRSQEIIGMKVVMRGIWIFHENAIFAIVKEEYHGSMEDRSLSFTVQTDRMRFSRRHNGSRRGNKLCFCNARTFGY